MMRPVLAALWVCAAPVLVIGFVYLIRRYIAGAQDISAFVLGLWIAAALFILVSIGQSIYGAPANLTSDHRLAPTSAWLRGYKVYYPPEKGPALSTIYGPVTVWVFIPAGLFDSPVAAVRVGTAINIAFYYIPLAWLLWILSKAPKYSRCFEILMVGFALTIFNEALSKSWAMIHADAPAIGLALVACIFAILAIRTKTLPASLLAGFAAALSVLTKQNMVAAVPVLFFYLLLCRGWKPCMGFLASFTGCVAILISISIGTLGPWSGFLYNVIYIPTHQPYLKVKVFPAFGELADLSLVFVIVAVACLAYRSSKSGWPGLRTWLKQNPSAFLLFTGLVLCVTSILGRIKVVGDLNAFCPSLYLFLAACLVELLYLRESIPEAAVLPTGVRAINLGRVITTAILLFLVIGSAPAEIYQLIEKPTRYPMQEAFEFSKQHPGEVYFPQLPLSSLLGERKLWHFAWGLSDRAKAGHPVSSEYFYQLYPPMPKSPQCWIGFGMTKCIGISGRR